MRQELFPAAKAQRIRLATQIGSGLVGVAYILDEPSIGLHQRDNDRLLGSLMKLRDLGNSLIVVEHDEDTMRAADCIVDIGPGAGGAWRTTGCHGNCRGFDEERGFHHRSLSERKIKNPGTFGETEANRFSYCQGGGRE